MVFLKKDRSRVRMVRLMGGRNIVVESGESVMLVLTLCFVGGGAMEISTGL